MFRSRSSEEEPPKQLLLGRQQALQLAQQMCEALNGAGLECETERVVSELADHYSGACDSTEIIISGDGAWMLRRCRDRSMRVVHNGWRREDLLVEEQLKHEATQLQRQHVSPEKRRGRLRRRIRVV